MGRRPIFPPLRSLARGIAKGRGESQAGSHHGDSPTSPRIKSVAVPNMALQGHATTPSHHAFGRSRRCDVSNSRLALQGRRGKMTEKKWSRMSSSRAAPVGPQRPASSRPASSAQSTCHAPEIGPVHWRVKQRPSQLQVVTQALVLVLLQMSRF